MYEFCSIANVNTRLINIIGIHFTSILVLIVSYFCNTAMSSKCSKIKRIYDSSVELNDF